MNKVPGQPSGSDRKNQIGTHTVNQPPGSCHSKFCRNMNKVPGQPSGSDRKNQIGTNPHSQPTTRQLSLNVRRKIDPQTGKEVPMRGLVTNSDSQTIVADTCPLCHLGTACLVDAADRKV